MSFFPHSDNSANYSQLVATLSQLQTHLQSVTSQQLYQITANVANTMFMPTGLQQFQELARDIIKLLQSPDNDQKTAEIEEHLIDLIERQPAPYFNAIAQMLLSSSQLRSHPRLKIVMYHILEQIDQKLLINSYYYTSTLKDLALHSHDLELKSRVLKALRGLSNQYIINDLCKTWANTRNPDLEALVVEKQWIATDSVLIRVLTILKTGKLALLTQAGKREFKVLLELLNDRDPEIARRAIESLYLLEDKVWARDLLATTWFEKRLPFLLELLTKNNYLPQRPVEVRVRLALKLDKLDFLTNPKPGLVTHLVEAAQDSDPEIAQRARDCLGTLKRREAQQILCNLVIENDLPFVQAIALKVGYLPSETYQKALFYFVTEQWDKYDVLDFDQRILHTAYHAASPGLRRRLAERVRAAGRVEYLTALAGSDYRSRTAELNLDEAKLLVQILAANQEWSRLWPLVFELPLEWSILSLRLMSEVGWQPLHANQEEQDLFRQLKTLALQSLITNESEVTRQLPPAILRAKARITGRINDLAFSSDKPWLVLGNGTGKVILWNMKTAQKEEVLGNFAHSISQLCFTPGGRLIVAERANSESAPCGIYSWQEGQWFRLGQHHGSITALVSLGDEQVLSAGRDGRVVLWNVKEQTQPAEIGPDLLRDWSRSVCVNSDSTKVAVSGKYVRVLSMPNLKIQTLRFYRPGWVVQHSTFAPDGKTLLLGHTNGEVIGTSLKTNGELNEKFFTLSKPSNYPDQVEALTRLPNLPLLLVARSGGSVQLIDWSSQNLVGQVQIEGKKLSALRLSPDGYFMAVAEDEKVFSLWDLRVLELCKLLSRPLAQGRAVHMAALTLLKESNVTLTPYLENTLRFIELVLRHRMRHDVELSEEIASIHAGDFDIEIE